MCFGLSLSPAACKAFTGRTETHKKREPLSFVTLQVSKWARPSSTALLIFEHTSKSHLFDIPAIIFLEHGRVTIENALASLRFTALIDARITAKAIGVVYGLQRLWPVLISLLCWQLLQNNLSCRLHVYVAQHQKQLHDGSWTCASKFENLFSKMDRFKSHHYNRFKIAMDVAVKTNLKVWMHLVRNFVPFFRLLHSKWSICMDEIKSSINIKPARYHVCIHSDKAWLQRWLT